MVDTPKMSFIPKQTIGGVPGRVPHRQRSFNLLSFIGMAVFLCGMILAVGVFLYKDFSEKALATQKQELEAIKSSFSQSDIQALRELDRRISVSRALLDSHLSPSVVFDALELRTQRDLSFTDFSYERRESGSVEMILKGNALRFNTVALQSQQLADAPALSHTIFSDLAVDEKGLVHFTVTSEGDNSKLVYAAPAAATSTSFFNSATTSTGVTDLFTTATTSTATSTHPAPATTTTTR